MDLEFCGKSFERVFSTKNCGCQNIFLVLKIVVWGQKIFLVLKMSSKIKWNFFVLKIAVWSC